MATDGLEANDNRPDTSLTRWAAGIVLALMLIAAIGAATMSYSGLREKDAQLRDVDAQLASSMQAQERRITALETAFAALNAANVEQHKQLLAGVERIETRLDRRQAAGRE